MVLSECVPREDELLQSWCPFARCFVCDVGDVGGSAMHSWQSQWVDPNLFTLAASSHPSLLTVCGVGLNCVHTY